MEEQDENGAIQIFAPIAPTTATKTGVAGWGDAMVIVPYKLYLNYGDKSILEECYPAMKRWLTHEKHRAATKNTITVKVKPRYWFDKKYRAYSHYLWNDGFHFGDWLIPSKTMKGGLGMMSSVFFGREQFASGYYANSVAIMEKVAAIIDKETDSKKYHEELVKIKKAYANNYISKDGTIKPEIQGVQAMSLAFGLVPKSKKPTVAEHLVQLIHKNDDRLDTGFLSVDLILDALWYNGKKDMAYKLLYQNKCPSWLYEIENGATTLWEKWNTILPDGERQKISYNHYAFGCVGKFLYRHVAGIQNAGVGYGEILIKPEPDERLTYAKGVYESIYGTISSEWKKENGKFTLTVSIPCNTKATINLPNGELHKVGSGTYSFQCEAPA